MMYCGNHICISVAFNVFSHYPLEGDFLATFLPLMLINSLKKGNKSSVTRVQRASGNLLVACKFDPKVIFCSGAFTLWCHMWSHTHNHAGLELMVLPTGLLHK